jgi:hypothetical protein
MKLVLVLVLIAAWLTARSAAMAAASEDTAATLAVCQMECRPLSPRLRARLTELTQTLDGDRIAVSVTEKRQDLLTSGKKLWCATARRVVVDPLDRSR